MSKDFGVKLGQSTNLLAGYQADIVSIPFTTSSKPALNVKQVEIKNPDNNAKWSWPTITFHQNVEDLLSAVLHVKLRPLPSENEPSNGGTPSVWPAGAIMLAGLDDSTRQKALQQLSKQLGIDVSKSEWSYALVRCSRKTGTATHQSYERGMFSNPDPDQTVAPDALAALKQLEKLGKTSTDVSMTGANGYLNFFKTYGTHFVSSVDAGDSIFQVFAYDSIKFNNVLDVYKDRPGDLSGPASSFFYLFTIPQNDAGYGYTAAIGNMCIASGDPEMGKSLKSGLWLDSKFAGTNSIFAPYIRADAINIDDTFKKTVAISIELSSISVFAEYYRMLIWHQIFKASMFFTYANSSGVAPHIGNNCPYDLDSLFKGSDPLGSDGLLSTLCTPTVNMMQEKIALNKIVLTFPEVVTSFGVFANAIQITSQFGNETLIDLPGSSKVTLLGHIINSSSPADRVPPTIRLSNAAFNDIKTRLFCGEFYGCLKVSNSDNSRSCVIINGLLLADKNGQVSVVRDVRESPSLKLMTERLTDIQFALVSAEARLSYLLLNPTDNEENLAVMKHFLMWLAGVAGSNYQYDKLAPLQARAIYLAKVAATERRAGLPVPHLKYEAFKDVVENVKEVIKTSSLQLTNFQNQIRQRMAEERNIDRQNALNENIIKSGNLLQGYVNAQATYQEDLEGLFSSVITEKEKEMKEAVTKSETLQTSLGEQRIAVDKAIINYQDAVADWQKRETIKAGLDIASGIFSLGFAFITPSSTITSLVELGKTVQRIQKLVNVFDAVIKTYKAIKELPKNPQLVFDALKDVTPDGLAMPSSLEWDEMKVNFLAVLNKGPNIRAKQDLSAAFSILVLRGKALLECQGVIQSISADLSEAQQRLRLHSKQKKRLDYLKVSLTAKPKDLDVQKIDLIGLSGQLLFFQREMLMTMASTVVLQDRALQYEYLRQPTPIGAFTLLSLQLTIFNQSQSINQGLTVQPPPITQDSPIVYEIHGVRPESITNNQSHTFTIDVNKREFASYNYVRVQSVAVEIDGIISTKSGKYYTELLFDGNPFFDRGFDGEILTFQTISRLFTGLNEVKNANSVAAKVTQPLSAATNQDSFGDKISNITPFSKWRVSLPQTISNEEIKFEEDAGGITIRLIFQIYAQLKEPSIAGKEVHQRSRRSAPTEALAAASSTKSLEASLAPSTSVSKNEVLSMMSGKSVCAGWDVVFSLTAEEINKQLSQQYNDRKGIPKFLRESGKHVDEQTASSGMKAKTEFDFKFDAPKLQFRLNNSNSAEIFMPIISGSYKYSINMTGEWVVFQESQVKQSDGSYIRGDVPLAILEGSVSSQKNVAVSLNNGSFTAEKFEVGESNPMLRSALTDYFTNLKDGYEVYNFGTLDFDGISVLASLRPTNFQFNVYHTPSNRDLLQLFIATTGNLQSATAMYLKEPVPTDYDCSLIVNTKIFFEDILPTSLGEAKSDLSLRVNAPVSDGNKDKIWSSEATAGSVASPFPQTLVATRSEMVGINFPQTIWYEDYVAVDNNSAVVNLTGMKFETGDALSGYNTKMKYDPGLRNYPFKYGTRSKGSFGGWSSIKYSNYSLQVGVKMNANLPLSVTGSGQNQMVEFATTTSNVVLTGNLEPPAGACQCNDRELQKKFLDSLQQNVPPKLKNTFNQKFKSLSIFALKNLLFPAKNLIDMKDASVPGDMVVFGKFTSG